MLTLHSASPHCTCTCTQAKTRELKQNLNNEFRSIHELCMFVLTNTRKVELLRATLTALAAYLSWVPPGASAVGRLSWGQHAHWGAVADLIAAQVCIMSWQRDPLRPQSCTSTQATSLRASWSTRC